MNEAERLRACFAPHDRVTFVHGRKPQDGVIIRTNPARAVVRVDQAVFHVPYERLYPDPSRAVQRAQRIASIHQLATGLMARHGLKKWEFRFDHGTRRAGCCNYRDRLISISFNHAQSGSDDDIRDTILHEIAHALVGRRHHHDAVWQAKAHEIGCSGHRTHRLELAPPRWKVHCENRCWTRAAQRRNPRLVCRKCGGKLVYSAC